ncbi:MAG: AAA family ATPase [Eubacterium sp.]|nr:AAA family ATPase [Eubacterium sp.]
MGKYLNSRVPYEAFKAIAGGRYFVDKSRLLGELMPAAGMEERFFCITRPRRFGKSVMANMVGAFFGKAADAEKIFQKLEIARMEGYRMHLNSHDVICIDFSRIPRGCTDYARYISRIEDGINHDLAEAYPQCHLAQEEAVWDNLSSVFEETAQKFVFVIDEWDAPFYLPFVTEKDRKEYLLFLKSLLKGQAYVELAYMTGVLPIAKYSSGSELNGFLEYDMANTERFGTYFGFLDGEVDRLYQTYRQAAQDHSFQARVTRDALAEWYDGYYTASGEKIYNPRSVVYALTNNQIRNYWTSSGPYDEIFYYIKNNTEDVRDDLAWMVSGDGVEARMLEYAATAPELNTKDQIYSAMVIYGLLTYEKESGRVFIPNKELMGQFDELLISNENLGYMNRLAKASAAMLKATLAGDTKAMAEILNYAHDTESPIFSYNSEIELSAVVNLVYLAARDKYRIEREDKAGKGYVDFIFYPQRQGAECILLELKVDASPMDAIRQVREKNYMLRFQGKLAEKPKYTGKILAVGIAYDRKTKEHQCMVEELGHV